MAPLFTFILNQKPRRYLLSTNILKKYCESRQSNFNPNARGIVSTASYSNTSQYFFMTICNACLWLMQPQFHHVFNMLNYTLLCYFAMTRQLCNAGKKTKQFEGCCLWRASVRPCENAVPAVSMLSLRLSSSAAVTVVGFPAELFMTPVEALQSRCSSSSASSSCHASYSFRYLSTTEMPHLICSMWHTVWQSAMCHSRRTLVISMFLAGPLSHSTFSVSCIPNLSQFKHSRRAVCFLSCSGGAMAASGYNTNPVLCFHWLNCGTCKALGIPVRSCNWLGCSCVLRTDFVSQDMVLLLHGRVIKDSQLVRKQTPLPPRCRLTFRCAQSKVIDTWTFANNENRLCVAVLSKACLSAETDRELKGYSRNAAHTRSS